jgi:hypothetical protein
VCRVVSEIVSGTSPVCRALREIVSQRYVQVQSHPAARPRVSGRPSAESLPGATPMVRPFAEWSDQARVETTPG